MEIASISERTRTWSIPAGWAACRIGDLSTIATGSTPPTADACNYGEDFLFVSPGDIGEAKHISNTEKKLSRKGWLLARHFPRESVLFVCIGSTIGKCGMALVELTANQQINAIYPSPNFSSDFIYYATRMAAPRIRALAGEQAVPIVNKSLFSDTEIWIPPLPEQRAIAGALGDVDGLLGGAGAAHRQEARPQADRHAAAPHRPDPPPGLHVEASMQTI